MKKKLLLTIMNKFRAHNPSVHHNCIGFDTQKYMRSFKLSYRGEIVENRCISEILL